MSISLDWLTLDQVVDNTLNFDNKQAKQKEHS